jgi:predicted nucleic acid-binding protein
MNGILLDTSGYSALRRSHAGVESTLSETDTIFMNPIILGELLAGFRKGTREPQNEKLLKTFLEQEDVRILPMDEETAERYAVIYDYLRRSGTPVSPNDLWIAATAMQHGIRLLTTDTDFQKIPQILVDLF